MWEIPKHFRVKFGGNIYVDAPAIIYTTEGPLVTLKRHDDNGYLGIYFDIYDAIGRKLAAVKRNEIYPAIKTAKDYRIDGTMDRYVFSEKATGAVLCDIRKRTEAGDWELDVSVRLYTPKGFLFDATPTDTNLGGIKLSNNLLHSGVFIGDDVVGIG
jgi:hypothetical protein